MQPGPNRATADLSLDSNDSVAARYLGGKRAACDRCRGQKLRCPRDGQSGLSDSIECARCAKVGAVCSFGTSKRAGRPSNSKFKVSTENSEHRNAERGASSGTTLQEPREFAVFDVTRPEDRNFEPPPFGGPGSTLPGVEEGMTPFFNAQYPFTFGPFDGDFSWPIPPPLGIGSSSLSMSNGGPRPGAETSLPETSSSAPCMVPALSKIRKAAQVRGNSGDKMEWEGSDRLQIKIPQSPLASNVGYSNHGSSPALAQDVRHRRMQELSELGMTVYAQVMENDCRDETDPFSLSSPHDLAGKVLESSIKFLNLLTSSYTSHTAPLSASKSVCAAWSDDDIASTPEALEFNLTSTDESSTTRSDERRRQRKPSGSSNDVDIDPSSATSDTNPQPADVTEVFALLTCYIRILHLHSLLYSRLSLSLAPSLQNTSTNSPPPPLFPGLCIGAVSLDRFAKFQIKLLLQISVHLLGEIEKVLGLPDRYRISKKQNEDQGIFDGAVSAQFIEMTMEEKGMVGGVGAGGGDKEDRFRSITESLVRLRKMLKGSIDP